MSLTHTRVEAQEYDLSEIKSDELTENHTVNSAQKIDLPEAQLATKKDKIEVKSSLDGPENFENQKKLLQ